MDFILEHTDDPIPEAGAQNAVSSGGTGQDVLMDEDEDEETAALRAAYGKASANIAGAAPDVEAKVCFSSMLFKLCITVHC
jgi:hypothetical protein